MKKILLTIYMILFTSACVSNSNIPNDNIDKIYLEGNQVFPGLFNEPIDIKIINFNYKNHQYLYFVPYNNLKESCVVHDPDCPCNKNNSM
jgi:hypothetical protein